MRWNWLGLTNIMDLIFFRYADIRPQDIKEFPWTWFF